MRSLTCGLAFLLCVSVDCRSAAAVCAGDCNGDNDVTIDEIIKGVAIALGASQDICPSLDSSGDGEITIDELIRAVNHALNSCPPVATPTASQLVTATVTPTSSPTLSPTSIHTVSTPSPTATVSQPSATPTATLLAATPTATVLLPGNPALRTAGMIDTLTTVLRAVPTLISMLVGQSREAALQRVPAAEVERTFTCPGGGGGSYSCDRPLSGIPPRFGPPTFTVLFEQCVGGSESTGTFKLDGILTAEGQNGDTCATIPEVVTLTVDELTIDASGARGSVRGQFANFSAVTTFSCSQPECVCKADSIGMELSGQLTLSATVGGQEIPGVNANFNEGASILLNILQYNEGCSPVVYNMSVNGDVEVATQGTTFVTSFAETNVASDATSGQELVSIDGGLESACLGASVALRTRSPLAYEGQSFCPLDGQILVDHDSVTDLLDYGDPGVVVDLGDDATVDATFSSCVDPQLFVCAESD